MPTQPTIAVFSLWLLFPAVASAVWEVAESPHFRVYYRAGTVAPAPIVQHAEEFYAEMHRLTRGMPNAKIDIRICNTQADFQAAVHAPIQDWAVGCAFPRQRRVFIQNPTHLALAKLQLAQVLRHEIAHVLFWQYTQKASADIPLWFVEGIAIYLAKEWVPSRHETLLSRIFSNTLLPLSELAREFPTAQEDADLAYAQSQDALRWLVEVKGSETLWAMVEHLHAGHPFHTAFEDTVGWDVATFDARWQASLSERYQWMALFSNVYLFWGGIGGLALLSYLFCRQRRRKHLKKLAEQEQEIDAFFEA